MPDHDCEYKREVERLKGEVLGRDMYIVILERKLAKCRAREPRYAWMPGAREEMIADAWQRGLDKEDAHGGRSD